jgi:hypothetical protein
MLCLYKPLNVKFSWKYNICIMFCAVCIIIVCLLLLLLLLIILILEPSVENSIHWRVYALPDRK